ncbi:MAG: fumarylacetoacetate hydrolase family protein [Chloroflexi bacterium]|nr:fumarylacetoacetate hydrolase family protein [Chloroflexota bacterium]
MKIVRFINPEKKIEYGVQEGDIVRCIKGLPYNQLKYSGSSYKLGSLKLLAPCVPTKIIGVMANSRKVLEKYNLPIPTDPVVFFKPISSVIGPEDNIVYPDSSSKVNYEGELAVIIKSKAHRVSKEDTLKYVLGYTCFNDVGAVDWIFDKNQRSVGKGYDTFSPFGPCIETELDPMNAETKCYVNGKLMTEGNTNELIFSAADQVSFLSHIMTLLPGDIITIGNPGCEGIVKRGDTVEIQIEPIGTLRNYVV